MSHSFRDRKILAPLCKDDIHKHLLSLKIDHISDLRVYPCVTSTNDYLLENEFDSQQIVVCVAEEQTQGRGRYGHQWVSPSSVNLYLSMLWPLQDWNKKYETLSLWLLIAIAELLEKHDCDDVKLKWPNDICVGDKKLAGILIERKVGGAKNNLIIGVGLNIAMSLNKDVSIDASWIDLVSIYPGWSMSRNELAANIISVFYDVVTKLEENQLSDLSESWSCYDMLLNKKIEFLYQKEKRIAYVQGINEQGQIILDAGGKREYLHSAYMREIKIIGN
ncbi:MAG: biotin--[acetyl-CoA-carboxylase] ligase [Gammaproteobacteria bacterium]